MFQLQTSVIQNNQETKSSIQNLERQVGQMATTITKLEAKDSGKLPSQTEKNPRETANAITLRGGKVLGNAIEKELAKKRMDQDSGEISCPPLPHVVPTKQKELSTSEGKECSGEMSWDSFQNVVPTTPLHHAHENCNRNKI